MHKVLIVGATSAIAQATARRFAADGNDCDRRNRLHPSGVHVLTTKLGLVDTPMTAAFRKGLLWTTPEVVAAGIYKAIKKKKDVVYLPWFWYPMMLLIRAMPETFFKRMRL